LIFRIYDIIISLILIKIEYVPISNNEFWKENIHAKKETFFEPKKKQQNKIHTQIILQFQVLCVRTFTHGAYDTHQVFVERW